MSKMLRMVFTSRDPVTGREVSKEHLIEDDLIVLATSSEHLIFGIYRGLKHAVEDEVDRIRKAGPAGPLP